ncbi:MAG: 2-oxo acid dehydrogenase subunit E2 [Chloroflexota bacterium]|nr:2-oxo acid dehydrogenase subunit E2 [Chloroflexota bacterium]
MSVTRVIMPKLGLTMDEGRLIAWHKNEGDRVAEGEVLFEVETDKAAMEVPATTTGFVRRLLAKPDDMVPVATDVAIITSTADEALGDAAEATPSPRAAARIPRPTTSPQPSDQTARRSSSADRVIASPAARKRAQELGVDLATVVASKPPRISMEDVEAAAAGSATPAPYTAEKRIPLSRMRKAIAAAMSRSTSEAPQFSIERDVDMTAANARRKQAGASFTDVVVLAAALSLAAHPRLRSRFDGDAIVEQAGAHIGLAVAVSDGLLVPVIRDADKKDLATLEQEREHLEEGARAGRLSSDELTGAVFSVSNLGSLGVDRFTALVNPPEAAILAMGRVRDQVVARDGGADVRPVVTLTLSVDHRVADGADAARFLDDVVKQLEAAE